MFSKELLFITTLSLLMLLSYTIEARRGGRRPSGGDSHSDESHGGRPQGGRPQGGGPHGGGPNSEDDSTSESPLNRAMQHTEDRIRAETESVNRRKQSAPNSEGSEDRLMSFLSSNNEVKFLSNFAATQLYAARECREQHRMRHLSCPDFWRRMLENGCEGAYNFRPHPPAHHGHGPGGGRPRHTPLFPHRYRQYDNAPDFSECPLADAPECDSDTEEFRTLDGSCNNRREGYTLAGAANIPLARNLPADYDDCVSTIRKSVSGSPLPSARAVSQKIFTPIATMSVAATMMHMTYGQLLDHDSDITAISKFEDPETEELVNIACGTNGCDTTGLENEECLPITVPADDNFFNSNDKPCLKFVRSQEFLHENCELGAREQPNQITSWLDASFLYGNSDSAAESLRTLADGKMATSPHPVNPDFKDLLPMQDDASCRNATPEMNCFQAGDGRRNEQVGLQALHTIFVRYHNYIVDNLAVKHPSWDDEELYQNARKIVGAVWQHTVYNEYLPLTLGPEFMRLFDLNPKEEGLFYTGYTDNVHEVKPDTTSEFAGAAFRFGHSQIGDTLRFSDPTYSETEDVPWTKVFFNPTRIYHSGIRNDEVSGVNAVMLGMLHQKADAMDAGFSTQVTNSLFTDSPPHGPGGDLPATNVQRGRDHGLTGYNNWREWCFHQLRSKSRRQNLLKTGRVTNFEELVRSSGEGNIAAELVAALKEVYGSNNNQVNDIDLFAGGIAEDTVTGGLVGATFGCILAKQFSDLKRGDRFYYENEDYFNAMQLNNIREQTFSSILCQSLEDDRGLTNNPETTLQIQKYALLQTRTMITNQLSTDAVQNAPELYSLPHLYPDGENNEIRVCAELPSLNFDLF